MNLGERILAALAAARMAGYTPEEIVINFKDKDGKGRPTDTAWNVLAHPRLRIPIDDERSPSELVEAITEERRSEYKAFTYDINAAYAAIEQRAKRDVDSKHYVTTDSGSYLVVHPKQFETLKKLGIRTGNNGGKK